jgi:sterol desaturase/sphingolipid hydroxylase (fatty acid hydroxylase superfamily)
MSETLSLVRSLLSSCLWTAALLAIYALLFIPLERIFASLAQPAWRRGSLTDMLYWFLLAPANRLYSFVLAAAVSAFSLRWLAPSNPPALLGHLPTWLQAVLFAFVLDFIQYWCHRLLHSPHFWRVHEIHHSATELDWLTVYRRHPLELWFARASALLAAWFVISPSATVLFTYVTSFTNFLPHANLNWTYGPFRYVFVSPVFHRWHHTRTDEGGLRNFANIFSCIDLLFGTYYLPPGLIPVSLYVR